MEGAKQTLGQIRVKAEFNPAKDDLVDQIKNKSATMIDMVCSSVSVHRENLNYESTGFSSIIADLAKSEESKRCVEIANKYQLKAIKLINKGFVAPETADLICQHIETSCMYAIKAKFTV